VTLPDTLLDRGPPIYMADNVGRIRYANTAFRELAQLLDQDLRSVAARLDPEHPELILQHQFTRDGATRPARRARSKHRPTPKAASAT